MTRSSAVQRWIEVVLEYMGNEDGEVDPAAREWLTEEKLMNWWKLFKNQLKEVGRGAKRSGGERVADERYLDLLRKQKPRYWQGARTGRFSDEKVVSSLRQLSVTYGRRSGLFSEAPSDSNNVEDMLIKLRAKQSLRRNERDRASARSVDAANASVEGDAPRGPSAALQTPSVQTVTDSGNEGDTASTSASVFKSPRTTTAKKEVGGKSSGSRPSMASYLERMQAHDEMQDAKFLELITKKTQLSAADGEQERGYENETALSSLQKPTQAAIFRYLGVVRTWACAESSAEVPDAIVASSTSELDDEKDELAQLAKTARRRLRTVFAAIRRSGMDPADELVAVCEGHFANLSHRPRHSTRYILTELLDEINEAAEATGVAEDPVSAAVASPKKRRRRKR